MLHVRPLGYVMAHCVPGSQVQENKLYQHLFERFVAEEASHVVEAGGVVHGHVHVNRFIIAVV